MGVILVGEIIDPSVPNPNNNTIFAVDKNYVHTQAVAAATWNVYHNLGKHPSIHIEDIGGSVVIAEIIHVDNNHAQILFGSNRAGFAYCN